MLQVCMQVNQTPIDSASSGLRMSPPEFQVESGRERVGSSSVWLPIMFTGGSITIRHRKGIAFT